jgi:dolichol-phosphate mannosyltransferase
MGKKPEISVVIPAKNEADGIKSIINAAAQYCNEIIVVDGNSTDRTAEIAGQAGAILANDGGKGKGAAYKQGIKKAKGDIIVFMDADGSHCADDIPKLVKPIQENQADLVIGSRHRGGSDEWEGNINTYIRHVGSGILTLGINYRWRINLTDCLNGFRAARRDAVLKVKLRANGFDVEQHMIAQFLKRGYRVTEVGTHEYCRAWGKSKLPTYKKAYLFFWRLFLDIFLPW